MEVLLWRRLLRSSARISGELGLKLSAGEPRGLGLELRAPKWRQLRPCACWLGSETRLQLWLLLVRRKLGVLRLLLGKRGLTWASAVGAAQEGIRRRVHEQHAKQTTEREEKGRVNER